MTKRLLFPEYWASGGDAKDPDTDTTHPSFEADRYADKGWHSEKPPEEWQNFLTQISDEKIISKMVDGLTYFDASVTYQEGAVYRKDDKFYKIEGGVEQEVLSPERAVYLSLIAAAQKLYDDHLAADNPHNDTVDTLLDKSYIKSDVDGFYGDPVDPRTIVWHMNRTGGGVHGETAVQTGALAAADGGNFTGDVTFLNSAIIQVTPSKSIHYNKATGLFEIVNGTRSIGVDADGRGYMTGPSGTSMILSESNLDAITIKYNNSFALPTPLVRANLRADINDLGIGYWELDTATTPVHADGLKVDDNVTIFKFDSYAFPVTVHVLITQTDGTQQSLVKDFTSWNPPNNLQTMVGVHMDGTDPAYFREYTIYPQLSARQKTMLVTK